MMTLFDLLEEGKGVRLLSETEENMRQRHLIFHQIMILQFLIILTRMRRLGSFKESIREGT